MSIFTRFSAPLDLRYHSESVWETLTPFQYDVSSLGSGITAYVPKGFFTDLGTIPRIVWSYISPMECAQCFVLHDWLTENQYLVFHQDSGKQENIPVSRVRVDDILLESMVVMDVPALKRVAIYKAVSAYRIAKGIK